MDKKNIFISHAGEDADSIPKVKKLIANAGLEIQDGSITNDNPNDAKNVEYIKNQILAPQIQWASTLVVLISRYTANSWWVNWEIQYAAQLGKRVIGVFVQGATNADIPDELSLLGDATVVGWRGDAIVGAINGQNTTWTNPDTGKERDPEFDLKRVTCR